MKEMVDRYLYGCVQCGCEVVGWEELCVTTLEVLIRLAGDASVPGNQIT